jgi:manganese efflux pump family protein
MSILSLFALAVALAMDAFAVAIATGLTLKKLTVQHIVRMSISFGFFQALMPCIGWGLGRSVHIYIAAFDHWVAFALLLFVGAKMIWGAWHHDEADNRNNDPTTGLFLLVLSVATSIDALAVGLSLAMIGASIVFPATIIGIVAFIFTSCGMMFGRRIGALWETRVEAIGGLVLIAIGVNILRMHLLA